MNMDNKLMGKAYAKQFHGLSARERRRKEAKEEAKNGKGSIRHRNKRT
jgi:hypothetical protein